MVQRRRIVALFLTLALAFITCACPKNSQPSTKIRDAAKASDRLAVSIGSAIDLKRTLARQGTITPQEELLITNILLEANTLAKNFNATARSFKADTPENRSALLKIFGELSASVARLNDEGVFKIRDPDARQKFSLITSSISASLTVIGAALQ